MTANDVGVLIVGTIVVLAWAGIFRSVYNRHTGRAMRTREAKLAALEAAGKDRFNHVDLKI